MGSEQLYSILITTGRAAGITAFFLVGLTIFLGGAARALMKSVKRLKLFKLHERVGYCAYFILLWHPLLVLTAKVVNGTALLDFLISYSSYPPFVAGVVIFFIITLATLTGLLRKLVQRFIWINLMRISIVAHLVLLYHLFYLGTLSGPYGALPYLNIVVVVAVILSIGGAATRVGYALLARR